MITSMILSSVVCVTAFIAGYITGQSEQEKKHIDAKAKHIIDFTNDWINRNCKQGQLKTKPFTVGIADDYCLIMVDYVG